DVLIQMKHFHPLPIHVGRFREFIQKLELGGTGGGNDPCATMFTDGAAKGRGGLPGCSLGQQIFVRKDSDVHFGTSSCPRRKLEPTIGLEPMTCRLRMPVVTSTLKHLETERGRRQHH